MATALYEIMASTFNIGLQIVLAQPFSKWKERYIAVKVERQIFRDMENMEKSQKLNTERKIAKKTGFL